MNTLTILYEDKNVVVCIKPAGVQSEDTGTAAPAQNSIPAAAKDPVSLPALLRAYWNRPGAPLFCVHRLDTATGGVMVYAKTKAAAAALSAQITDGGFHKEYLCVCAGAPEPPTGEMHDFLFKDSRKGKVFPVKGARKGAKEARLAYEVLETRPAAAGCADDTAVPEDTHSSGASLSHAVCSVRAADAEKSTTENAASATFSLCRVHLFTGRTHQIRVQFASRKHPLFGDGKYGSRAKGPLGLWCRSLTFTLPGTPAPRTFAAEPPAAAPWAAFGCRG